MRVHQPSFVAFNSRIAVAKLDLTRAGGFHLSAGEYHPGLEAIHQEIIVTGLTVVAQDLDVRFFFRQSLLSNVRKRQPAAAIPRRSILQKCPPHRKAPSRQYL